MPVHRLVRRAAAVLACTAVPLTVLAGTATAAQPGTETVDLTRYAGAWYQVAAVPQLFEIQCKKNVKAVYTPQADGTVGVRNTCTTWWGSTSAVNGAARPLDASNTRLNVSFVPRPGGGFVNGGDGNYVIVGLAPDYSWAAVTNDDRSAGFLLSRTPALNAADKAAAVEAFTEAGVAACDLRLTRQDGGTGRTGPLC
ncbi:lipocalin family protein [Streptomyces genisteinicus]|uniref:Lipocalin family protein n=1 Tax=Streptomyces genisteinicus TaxID=2768068 RepID=A0A7H0I2C0_9ACTN|nr:lipocalin family protein [Streptomyces genisteinicus]QNP66936.1 lipocalin family protein [Streptomyces genisteinicus]